MHTGLRTGLLMIMFSLAVSACSTVTIREKGAAKLSNQPTWEFSKPYFFWGLVGQHHIDAKTICNGKSPKQVQAQTTVVDSILSIVTLGIYYPRTARIWCN